MVATPLPPLGPQPQNKGDDGREDSDKVSVTNVSTYPRKMASVEAAGTVSSPAVASSSAWLPSVHRVRTVEFIAFRTAAQRQKEWLGVPPPKKLVVAEDHLGANNEESGAAGSSSSIPPSWVTAVQSFRDLEASVSSRLDKLQSAQRDFFAAKFRPPEVEDQEKRDLDKFAEDVQRLLKEMERLIKQGIRVRDENDPEEATLASNVKRQLSSRFSTLLARFKAVEQGHADHLRKLDAKRQKFRNMGSSEETQRKFAQEDKVCSYLELGYSQAEIDELLQMDNVAQEQNTEVRKILQELLELQAMAKEMHALILEQGTMLDRIEYNVEKAEGQVLEGINQMKKAREQQKKCLVC